MAMKRESGVAWDDEFWVESPSLGSVGYLSSDKQEDPPVILVPDGAGDYREHRVIRRPRGRMGF